MVTWAWLTLMQVDTWTVARGVTYEETVHLFTLLVLSTRRSSKRRAFGSLGSSGSSGSGGGGGGGNGAGGDSSTRGGAPSQSTATMTTTTTAAAAAAAATNASADASIPLPNPVLAALEVSAACHAKARLYTRDRRKAERLRDAASAMDTVACGLIEATELAEAEAAVRRRGSDSAVADWSAAAVGLSWPVRPSPTFSDLLRANLNGARPLCARMGRGPLAACPRPPKTPPSL